jgi:hypothetical protein
MGDPCVLDEAYGRLASFGFDEPNGFVNHAPMACEALAALDRPDAVDRWSRSAGPGTPAAVPVHPAGFVWEEALGDHRRAGEWIGFFERALATDGWAPVVELWVPRLLPGLAAALFHGLIRTAHAVRAVSGADTPARRAELARSLGYWASLCTPGEPVDAAPPSSVDDIGRAVAEAAADGARRYLARPNIFNLHGVTAAMAVALLVDHVDGDAGVAGLAQVRAEHVALYRRTLPVAGFDVAGTGPTDLADAAVASGDAHAVKLVEACRRGLAATGDPAFAAAAERVVRRIIRTDPPAVGKSGVRPHR